MKDLGDVQGGHGALLAVGQSREMHEAAEIGGGQDIRGGGEGVVELEGAHGAGNVGEGHRKGTAKAAALILLGKGDEFQAGDGTEQGFHGGPGASAASVAGVMQGDAFGKGTGPGLDPQTVHEEVAQFPGAVAEIVETGRVRLSLELNGVAVDMHRRTGSGGDDDREITGKHGCGVPGNAAGDGEIAPIEGGLATTSLVGWKDDLASGVLENFHGGLGRFREKRIAQTGGHEEDTAGDGFGRRGRGGGLGVHAGCHPPGREGRCQ